MARTVRRRGKTKSRRKMKSKSGTKPKSRSKLHETVYNWFTVGGYDTYKNMFLLTEVEPLYEYIFLLMIMLIPVINNATTKEKAIMILLLQLI